MWSRAVFTSVLHCSSVKWFFVIQKSRMQLDKIGRNTCRCDVFCTAVETGMQLFEKAGI